MLNDRMEKNNMSEYKGYEYKFNFYITVGSTVERDLSFENAASIFKNHIHYRQEPITIGVNYTSLDNEKQGSMALADYSNNNIFLNKDMLGDIEKESYIRNTVIRDLENYEYSYKRANKEFESISDMFKRIENESFDSCDIDYDRIVTIDEPNPAYHSDPYDIFYTNVLDRVNVICDEDNKHSLCCDWSEFIYRYYDKLKDFANENWRKNKFDDPDDFVSEWIKETNLLLAGYGNDKIYKALNVILESDPETDSKIYQDFLKENVYPYISAQTREERSQQQKVKTDKAALDDYEKGKSFPSIREFSGLENYHVLSELNNVVIGIRSTDYTYATWTGSTVTEVSDGHYMMSREQAFEDFAIRAKLIDIDRLYNTRNYEYKKEDIINAINNAESLKIGGKEISEEFLASNERFINDVMYRYDKLDDHLDDYDIAIKDILYYADDNYIKELIAEQNIDNNSFDKAIRLINEYCEKEFDSVADFSNLQHIDLAYTTDEDTELPIKVYADLDTFRLVKEYDRVIVNEQLFNDLSDMNEVLGNLEFDKLVALSDQEKQKVEDKIIGEIHYIENGISVRCFTNEQQFKDSINQLFYYGIPFDKVVDKSNKGIWDKALKNHFGYDDEPLDLTDSPEYSRK